MRKIILLVAVTLMVILAAVPALAQNFEFEQEATSGDVVQVYHSSVDGNGNAVATDADFYANTGNYQSQQFVAFDSFNDAVQYASE